MFETPASGDKSIPEKGIYFGSLKGAALFGRPNISSAEIEAIESGGAAVAINWKSVGRLYLWRDQTSMIENIYFSQNHMLFNIISWNQL